MLIIVLYGFCSCFPQQKLHPFRSGFGDSMKGVILWDYFYASWNFPSFSGEIKRKSLRFFKYPLLGKACVQEIMKLSW